MFNVEDSMNDTNVSGGQMMMPGSNGSSYLMSNSAYNDIMNYNNKRSKQQIQQPQQTFILPVPKYAEPNYLYSHMLYDKEQDYQNKLKSILYDHSVNKDILNKLKTAKTEVSMDAAVEELLKDEDMSYRLMQALKKKITDELSAKKKSTKKKKSTTKKKKSTAAKGKSTAAKR